MLVVREVSRFETRLHERCPAQKRTHIYSKMDSESLHDSSREFENFAYPGDFRPRRRAYRVYVCQAAGLLFAKLQTRLVDAEMSDNFLAVQCGSVLKFIAFC